ncbi:MAG: hypothetical protein HXN72_06235 [Prevotella pallens]|uniref:ADP-ribosyltransferase-containing protein n=1 Tax=Prevotella pallens TaxID=60133 RepID=UPI001CB0325B|nr:hypothetical protein [Prevotella pallens]MBF1480435.1 hypothetical protein [Prevotella pallens]
MYHEVPVERTIEDLYDGSLDDTEIADFISANIEAAQKEYNSVVKKAPKISTDKAKYLQEKQAYQEEVGKAKAKVDYWQAVENERKHITHTSPEELKNTEDELSGEAARKDYRGITAGDEENTTSVEDLVRDFLRGAKITPEDFRKETGLSISEQKKFVGMISKQGKTIARLGEELADYDEWNLGGRFFDGDSNAARGAIIDVLLSSRTRGDFKQQDATEEEERYIEAVEQQREQWYYENYHMTYEEYLQYREIVLPELLRKYANFAPDVLYPQFVASFEDAYAAEHSQTNNTENNEQQRNDTTAEEPTTTPGDTVLQTEKANNSRGDSQSKEQPTEVPTGVRSSNENGTLPQSTPTEVESETDYTLSDKKAENRENFYQDANGNIDLANIPEEVFDKIGKPKAPLRLTPSMLKHVFDRHGKEMGLSRTDDAIDFILDVMDNFDHVRQGDKNAVIFSIENGRSRTGRRAVTILLNSESGEYYGIKTSGYERIEGLNKKPLLWEKGANETSATGAAPANVTTEQAQQGSEPAGSASNHSNGSADKVTQSSQTKETKEDKFSPTPRKDGESITDYAERVAEEHQAQRTRKEEEAKVDTNPTDAQKEAGNYKKGHIKVDGLNITIEQPKGSIRRGTDANGKQWESEMHNTYGYIRGTESVDGDHIDIFLSDNPTEGKVFVVDQINKDGSFDEHKVMYGFSDMESARQAYLSNYEEGWQGLGNITEVSKEDFKKWIDSSKRKTKPFAKYSTVKTQDDTQTKKPTEENAAPANTETNENYAHNSEKIMHEQKNVQLQQAINAYENATKFYYQQLKEGKLDKVFESKQWKDVLRKQTELQKALLQLNSEELKELLKQTTNEDTKKEIKGALDAVLRQEQRSIEYNAVLDKQEPITPIYKEEKKSIAVTEFVETDKKEAEIHPVLTGVYHDNGYVVGTNAHTLLARKEDYNKSLEGKITNKKGEFIDGKYPNWRAVVEGETTTNSWGINLDELHAFVRGVLAKLKSDGAKKSTIDSATIAFKDTDGKIIVCNAKTLDKALRGAKSIGATEFGNKSETFAHAQTKKGYVVCPTISTYHSINDNCFVYAPKEAARQQTTAILTNDTEAKQKATEAVLAALSKAGIEVVQATDEQAQAMLANEIGAEKQVVYHGSRAKFKNFDHSHMGEGEGLQAYGWGSYVTEVESIGRTYAAGNGKIKFRGFVLEAMHSLEVKEHFSGAERKVLNFLHKWIKRSNNASTAIEKVKEWASNEYEKYSGRRNWSDQDYKDYFGAISKRDVREWRKEMEEKEENAQQMLSFIETLSVDDFSLPQGHLYTVDIPDDTGSNYLNWEQPISDEQLDAIEEYLKENYRASRVKIFTDGIAKSNSSNAQEVDAFTRQGKNIYHLLEHTIGDDKSVSEMLGSLGYTGISYPAQYQSGGRADNARNYVIFNEKDLKITDHIQFMRTPQGTVYGWTVNGKIHLTKAGLNPETPIHEYTHLWADAMMKQNKQGWNSIKSLLKDTPVWKEVIADPNYSNIKDNEDAVASEVLSRISGKKNAAKMEEEAQRAIDEAKGVFEKAEAATVFLNLKRALKQFWHWVGKNVFGIKDFKNIDEVTDRVLYDLLSNTKLTEEDNEEIAKRDKLYLDAVERGDMETAQRMVNEAAAQNGYVPNSEYQGSSAFNGAAPYGNGYFLTKEERKGAYENDEFDGDTSLDDYVNSGIDPMNLDYLTNDSSYRHADDARKEAIENLRNVFQNKRQTITMYRSVPSSIKEGSFRNGDWVTPSYAYAVENARVHGWGNNYRIIEQKVPISDVWFDGNDIAEFGYGNENDFTNDKDYLYSNTKNNRKLPDAVTYDDKGNVIPLSKRFNKAKSDPRFQIVGNSLSDEEKKIVETAKANDTYMKAPNGKPTNLSEKHWAQVRTTAFKNWFGDWEKAARIEKVRRSKAVVISGSEYKDKYELNRDSAKEWIKDNLRGEYTIADTEEIVSLTKVGANKVTSHGMSNKAHLQSIAAIPQLIRNAIFIEERPNEKHNNKYDSYKYYICGLKIGTTDYTVKLTIGVKSGKKYYDHALTEIEKGKLLDRINDQADKKGFTTTGDAPLQSYALSIGKDSKLLSILQTNSSKVVDENGEPMVAYHGSNNEFTTFDTARIGSSTGTSDGRGFYFTTDKDYANSFGKDGNVLSVFLNIDNPLSLKEKTITKQQLFDIIKRIDEKEVAADGEHWFISNYANYYDVGIDGAIREAAESEYPYSDNDVELVNSLISASGNFKDVVNSVYEITGKSSEIVPKENGTVHYVVTSPYQIKSATGNNGNFSTTEDDILYRTVFGGNSGYVGYSMSKRAAEAKEEDRGTNTEPTANTETLTNHAESVVQNLHLNNVDIVPDGSSLNGEQATAKGFYNKRTGKIVVVAGNHTDIADIEKTVLHEAVAHYGLRELFGDNFDNFLDTVFAKADIETRQQIAHLAAKHGWNIRTATEEYLASMAEDTNFEQIKPTLWQRIKQLFGEIMSAFGLHHANITDNDLRYILWRSYKNLQNSGKHSILDKAEDIAMQYRLKAGNYADKFTNELNAVNERFNEELSNLTEENADKVTLWLGKPSKVLLAAGVEDKPMKLYGNKVIRKMKKHGFSLEELRDLPRAVADPVAVFNNYQREGNRSILTELKTQQGNFLVSVNIGKDADINFNIVRSVFGKGNENVVAWINNGLATYINKEKALSFLSHQSAPIAATAANAGQESSSYLHLSAPIAEAAENSELSSAAKIIKDFHNPKLNSNVLYRSSIDPTATEVLPDARTRYEKETKEPDNIGSVPKTHNFFRRFYKSYVDSMLALKSFTNSVLEATGDKMASHEDTYKAENAMTSKNKTDGEVYNPLFPYMPLYLYM